MFDGCGGKNLLEGYGGKKSLGWEGKNLIVGWQTIVLRRICGQLYYLIAELER